LHNACKGSIGIQREGGGRDDRKRTQYSILEFTGELASARSWPEVAAAYTSQGRKQIDAFSAQTRELAKLVQRVTTDALAPITSALPEMLETAAASS
jgi:hypothetical protein